MATDKSFMEDRESLDALIDLMPPAEAQEYRGYQALNMDAAFPGRRFVVYTLHGGAPEDVEVLALGAMRMSAQGGPTVELTSDRSGPLEGISMVPVRLRGRELFLHVPQKFEFKWKGKRSTRDGPAGVNFAPHYAVLMKTRSKPHLKVDGHTYCVRLNQFREMFPNLKVGY